MLLFIYECTASRVSNVDLSTGGGVGCRKEANLYLRVPSNNGRDRLRYCNSSADMRFIIQSLEFSLVFICIHVKVSRQLVIPKLLRQSDHNRNNHRSKKGRSDNKCAVLVTR